MTVGHLAPLVGVVAAAAAIGWAPLAAAEPDQSKESCETAATLS